MNEDWPKKRSEDPHLLGLELGDFGLHLIGDIPPLLLDGRPIHNIPLEPV